MPNLADRPPATTGDPSPSRRWLARLAVLLAATAVVILILFAGVRSFGMLAVGVASAAVSLAAAFWFLATRGPGRWICLLLLILSPIAALVAFSLAGLLWVAAASAAAWVLAGLTARVALAPDPSDWRMPERRAEATAAHPFVIMNPRSGGGKVAQFDLQDKAERMGAEVYLMPDHETVNVAEIARGAVARGADLLGVAGGDGTQALVADVAAEAGIPFVVVTAGTRNHFALDLGLDRDDPAACLSAL
ncbi:MAG: acylglycerol kinase family protein, partial [Actinobacteria bacterium]|nr:acylglycerol kinase family protein [Actinomycetota bacterium]